MSTDDEDRWHVGQLPFIWRPQPSPHNSEGLPDTLPFTLRVASQTGTFVQEPHPVVSSALARAYALGSAVTGQMDESGIGRGYADDFLTFIQTGRPSPPDFSGMRVLDVGCGNGYLLHRLASRGADVLGIDPGDHANAKYDVRIIRDFFPSSKVRGRFDMIIGFAMLEHVEDPPAFMAQLFEHLVPGGEVVLGVPDCGPYLQTGDISCLFHEHWSYFDHETLARTISAAGGHDVSVHRGRFGGMLYARATQGGADSRTATPGEEYSGRNALRKFREQGSRGVTALREYARTASASGETVGVYVPSRVVNAVFVGDIPTDNWRFFDDNPLLKGSYFPGIGISVEDRAALLARPTDRVLIMSRSFGKVIARGLAEVLGTRVRITTWQELFENVVASQP